MTGEGKRVNTGNRPIAWSAQCYPIVYHEQKGLGNHVIRQGWNEWRFILKERVIPHSFS